RTEIYTASSLKPYWLLLWKIFNFDLKRERKQIHQARRSIQNHFLRFDHQSSFNTQNGITLIFVNSILISMTIGLRSTGPIINQTILLRKCLTLYDACWVDTKPRSI